LEPRFDVGETEDVLLIKEWEAFSGWLGRLFLKEFERSLGESKFFLDFG
jgi:hypothetical protein